VLSVIVTVLGGLSVVEVIYRILAGPPSFGSLLHQRAGAYLGLAATLGLTYGAYRSMRQEGGTDPATLEIERVGLKDGS
jgi:hypothetical protein